MSNDQRNCKLIREYIRKALHCSIIAFPVAYEIFGKLWALTLIAIFCIVVLCYEYMRFFKFSQRFFPMRSIDLLLRENEKNSLSGASYMAFTCLISCIFFQKMVFINAIAISSIADAAAALIGMQFGRHKYYNNKSLEGSIAFFVISVTVCITVGILYNKNINYFFVMLVCFFVTLVEAFSSQYIADDNITVPFSFSMLAVYLQPYY